MVIGQTVLALPIVAHYTLGTVRGADPRILPTALTLGAGPLRSVTRLALEVRFGIVAAVIAAFGRVVAEVGVAMMLGGNIRGYTRTMTTAIALETSKGEFAFGLALGIVLMGVALAVNLGFNYLQER
jgi:tungstate transport system permease protein